MQSNNKKASVIVLVLSISTLCLIYSKAGFSIETPEPIQQSNLHTEKQSPTLTLQYTTYINSHMIYIKQWTYPNERATWEITTADNQTLHYAESVNPVEDNYVEVNFDDNSSTTVYVYGKEDFLSKESFDYFAAFVQKTQ